MKSTLCIGNRYTTLSSGYPIALATIVELRYPEAVLRLRINRYEGVIEYSGSTVFSYSLMANFRNVRIGFNPIIEADLVRRAMIDYYVYSRYVLDTIGEMLRLIEENISKPEYYKLARTIAGE